jgi:hypothetical protein
MIYNVALSDNFHSHFHDSLFDIYIGPINNTNFNIVSGPFVHQGLGNLTIDFSSHIPAPGNFVIVFFGGTYSFANFNIASTNPFWHNIQFDTTYQVANIFYPGGFYMENGFPAIYQWWQSSNNHLQTLITANSNDNYPYSSANTSPWVAIVYEMSGVSYPPAIDFGFSGNGFFGQYNNNGSSQWGADAAALPSTNNEIAFILNGYTFSTPPSGSNPLVSIDQGFSAVQALGTLTNASVPYLVVASKDVNTFGYLDPTLIFSEGVIPAPLAILINGKTSTSWSGLGPPIIVHGPEYYTITDCEFTLVRRPTNGNWVMVIYHSEFGNLTTNLNAGYTSHISRFYDTSSEGYGIIGKFWTSNDTNVFKPFNGINPATSATVYEINNVNTISPIGASYFDEIGEISDLGGKPLFAHPSTNNSLAFLMVDTNNFVSLNAPGWNITQFAEMVVGNYATPTSGFKDFTVFPNLGFGGDTSQKLWFVTPQIVNQHHVHLYDFLETSDESASSTDEVCPVPTDNPPCINPAPITLTNATTPKFPVNGSIISYNVAEDRISLVVNAVDINTMFPAGQYIFYTKNGSVWYKYRTTTQTWSNEYFLTCALGAGAYQSQTQFDCAGYPVTVYSTGLGYAGIHYWKNGIETTITTTHFGASPNSIVTSNIIVILYIPPGYMNSLKYVTSLDNFVKECSYYVGIPGALQSYSLKQIDDIHWTFSFSTLYNGQDTVYFATT